MDLPRIGKPAPSFKEKAVLNDKVFDLSLSDYDDKYIVLFFYPMDFDYVCQTELIAFSDHVNDFSKLNTSIVACTTESYLAHLKWLSLPHKEGGIRDLRIPLIADKSMAIAKKFGVLNEEEGVTYRAMFIIDNNGILRQITINDRLVGRSIHETRRLIKTIQHADKLRENSLDSCFFEAPSSPIHKSQSLMCLDKSLARDLIE